MTAGPSLAKAASWGVTLTVAAVVAAIGAGFAAGVDLSVPGLLEIESTREDGKPATQFSLNPLGPLLLAALLTAAIWGAGRLRRARP